jgi:drug/metabolite transporter (DMT)-like permease
MGIFVQDLYANHGANWRANLFYSHFLSLPLFLPLYGVLRSQFKSVASSPPLTVPPALLSQLPIGLQKSLASTPQSILLLTINATMQLLCISGVNLLSAKTTSLAVTVVLNVRKLVSFILSIWLFGNPLSEKMVAGAVLVFGAGALYGWEANAREAATRIGRKSEQRNGAIKEE